VRSPRRDQHLDSEPRGRRRFQSLSLWRRALHACCRSARVVRSWESLDLRMTTSSRLYGAESAGGPEEAAVNRQAMGSKQQASKER